MVSALAAEKERIADRYELVSPLGEGGMGVVWRARDTRLGRTVAVKLLTKAALGNETARLRLLREARAAATLEHDGIIRVYDVGELPDGGAYLVMELVRGKSLRDILGKGPLAPARAVRVIAAAARALDFAHQAGVIHRDVKPDNIMLRDDDRVTVVDFGVAKPFSTEIVADAETLAGVTSASLTGAGQIVGTPAYLSPEQARGTDVGAETDQFALAVTAFETLTGDRPWTGGSVVELVAAILKDAPAPLTALVPDAPKELESVLERALAKDPSARFQSMNAFAEALEQAGAGLPTAPPAIPVAPKLATDSGEGAISTHGGQSTTAKSPTTTKWSRLVALGIAAAGAIATVAVIGNRAPTSTAADAVAPAVTATAPVACPPFEVDGAGGYLGAAAAALACERVQLVRGGIDAKTLSPAELVSAPREIVPSFPSGLLDSPQSRETAVAAAKRAGPWLDGKLEKQVGAYVLVIVLRTAQGAELARGEGRAVEVFEAVRDALAPIWSALPKTTEAEQKHLREWLDVPSFAAASALLDVRTAVLIEDPTSLREACEKVETQGELAPRVLFLARTMCRKKLRLPPLTEPPPALDESTPGAFITTLLAAGTMGGPLAVRERAGRLEQARDRTTEPEGKARYAAAAAEIYNSIGDERARDQARASTLFSPKTVDWRTSAWHRVAFSQAADASLAAAISTWQPWEPITQSLLGGRRELRGDAASETTFEGRGYLLSRRGPYASAYGTNLLERGDIEAARNVAELAQDDILRVEIMLAEARYGAVLAKVPALLSALAASDETAAVAFRLAFQGMRASMILDRPADFVGPVVDRWVRSDPPHVVDGVSPFLSLVNACVLAPRAIGRPCIERLEGLRRDGKLATIFSTIETVLSGASRFVADDYVGAARVWRTLLRSSGWVQGPLREPLALAFDRAGEPDLGDEVDAPIVSLVDLPRTADLSWARAAKRAQKRGDTTTAKKYARAVVDKWRFADDKVPAAEEMRALLAKLPP